ncbi:MAG: hypothetical protein AAB551_00500 [Patescibacteria group bacterium]
MASAIEILIDQYLAQADAAFKAENFQEAYKICMKLMEVDSENSQVLEMKAKIEEAVQNYNIYLINKEIDKFEPLWKEERYLELVQVYQELYKAAPKYEKLEKLLSKAEEKYRDMLEKKTENAIQQYEKDLQDLLKQGKYQELIEKIGQTERLDKNKIIFRDLHIKMKDALVEKRLKEKKELLDSEKYEDVVNFLYQLKNLHPSSKKVEKLLRNFREKLLGQQLENKQDFVFRAKENIKNLVLLGKFEPAIQACEDLISIDPRNSFAKSTKNDCERKLKNLLQESMYQQITQESENRERDFNQNPENFIKL